jgi:hypothetical protein
MSHKHHPALPTTLVKYTALPGEYGYLEVIAESPHRLRLQLTDESVDLSRADAQEMIRVLSAWLAAPPTNHIVVRAEGDDAVVVAIGERQGADVIVVENEHAERSHVVRGPSPT